MNIFRLAFELFALYFLYKLIFDFIIPLAKTTKQVKKQFNSMQEQMQEKQAAFNQQTSATKANNTAPKQAPKKDDYIDFEEIK
jgi:Sec-independent protein translocase protein TatA